MERSTEQNRNFLEKEWLDHELRNSRAWPSYKSMQRDYACANKKFVVWDLINNQPRIVEMLQVSDVGVSWDTGLTILIKSSASDKIYTVTARPREHVEGVFFWIPGFADTRFAPFQYEEPGSTRRLTVPILFRTAHSRRFAGARYISSMKDFNAAWPGIFKG